MKRSSPPSVPQAPAFARSGRLAMATRRNGATERSTTCDRQLLQSGLQPVVLNEDSNQEQRRTLSAAGRGVTGMVAAPGSVLTGTSVTVFHWASQASASAP